MISDDVLNAFLYCHYKAFQLLCDSLNACSEYEQLKYEQEQKLKKDIIEKKKFILIESLAFLECSIPLGVSNLYLDQSFLSIHDFNIKLDLFEIKRDEVSYHIAPIFYEYSNALTQHKRLFYSIKCKLFGDLIKKDIQYFIFYNSHLEATKVKAGSYKSDAQKIIDELLRFKTDNSVPKFFRIKECNFCKYKHLCYEELKKKDCISLLGGANTKIVERFNNKGLFTINQLSYTFRPHKNDKRYYPELKALSLREGKIYIWNITEIKHSDSEIFIDIESLPDENFTYLIGLLVRNSTTEQYYSFWINSKSETLSLFS